MKILKRIINILILFILFSLIGFFIDIQIINAYYPLCDKFGYDHFIPKTFSFISNILDYVIIPISIVGVVFSEIKNLSSKLIKKILIISISFILVLVLGYIIDSSIIYISIFMANNLGDSNFISHILSTIPKYSFIVYNIVAVATAIIVAKL